MKPLPKYIRKKLWSIYNHQHAVKEIINEVMDWAKISFEDTDKESGWDWGMYVDMQGDIGHPDKTGALLQEYIANKTA